MTVLVGYTNSAEGRSALRHGSEIASCKKLPLVVFPIDEASVETDERLAGAASAGTRVIRRDRRDHSVASELLDFANESDVSVIGIRSRSRVGKLLLGSDAQTIILGARTPVLTVKGDDDGDL